MEKSGPLVQPGRWEEPELLVLSQVPEQQWKLSSGHVQADGPDAPSQSSQEQ